MDHAVRTSKTRPWDKLRFENAELECLYQRYTLKMQRFSVIGVVSLFVVFCLVMATLSFIYTNAFTWHVSLQTENNPFFHFTIYVLVTFCVPPPLTTLLNVLLLLLLFQNTFISLMGLLFLIILALLQFRVIQDTYLLLLCYGILVIATILCVMSMPSLSKYVPIDIKEVNFLLERRK